MDTKAKRAAALGFGTIALVLPVAAGALSVESSGQALGAYYFDLDDVVLGTVDVVDTLTSSEMAARETSSAIPVRTTSAVV